MTKLLIVDNEKIIVDGLVGYFLDLKLDDLEVYGTHSGKEALRLLEETKIDIVLSDIHMPGMSGLELQQQLSQRWPHCRMIFLSGYDDFQLIQQAMRGGAGNYILKTEGYEVIGAAVIATLQQLQEAIRFQSLIERSQKQFQTTLPFMGKELMNRLLQGDPAALTQRVKQFEHLQIHLDSQAPVLVFLSRIDHWRGISAPSDRALTIYSIQNIAAEYLSPVLSCYSYPYEASRMIWFIQPKEDESLTDKDMLWRRSLLFLQHSLEDIQATCNQLLNITLSFAVGNSFHEWDALQEPFESLKLLLNQGLGIREGAILLESAEDSNPVSEAGNPRHVPAISFQIHKLQEHLENGERGEFYDLLGHILGLPLLSDGNKDMIRLEVILSLGGMYLSAINRWGIWQELARQLDMDLLFRMRAEREWTEYKAYFIQLADVLFDCRTHQSMDQENDIVEKLENYIHNHFAEDLSMTKLGIVFNHHPYYLSRLYKQTTKISLLDYITEMRLNKAKQLLQESDLRVQDVSQAVGFISEGYFYRFFKKTVGMTPNEYREKPKL
ncbi:response regulator [Paenibacillus sp. 19GGS1-52]|uniref:response regulator n=1 Tax=Paenibacillus sp. 19GGS1-52 TaxID=2758563 RepID=UPI001EFBEED6|nr:helix-turn-helix domain-containing protein [Paenibacillus sp. 19GGS1-52]ULO04930.1 response regulator [Paenibacillus sp. 19GGS1-52]